MLLKSSLMGCDESDDLTDCSQTLRVLGLYGLLINCLSLHSDEVVSLLLSQFDNCALSLDFDLTN